MIWLTWRQLRTQAAIVGGALGVLVVVLAVTGPQLLDRYQARSGGGFLRELGGDRGQAAIYVVGVAVMLALPAVIGVFWGAPLVSRELEAGTHRLVWNQSVSRERWLAVKVGLTGLVAAGLTGLSSLAVSWWCSPVDRAIAGGDDGGGGILSLPRLYPVVFDARGIAPIGYAAFALALGVTAGVVVRRTVPAMAVTLAVFVAVQVAVPLWVRPHLVAPTRLVTTITAANLRGIMAGGPGDLVQELTVRLDVPGAWVISNRTVDARGTVADTLPAWVLNCGEQPPDGRGAVTPARQKCFAEVERLGYRQVVEYQPPGRYWPLQWAETAMYLVASLLLAGSCFLRLRRSR